MQKMTSAYANKLLKNLEEEKNFWVNKENTSCTYVAAINEEPVIPEYDYAAVSKTIEEIDEKMAVIKGSDHSSVSAESLCGGSDKRMRGEYDQSVFACFGGNNIGNFAVYLLFQGKGKNQRE